MARTGKNIFRITRGRLQRRKIWRIVVSKRFLVPILLGCLVFLGWEAMEAVSSLWTSITKLWDWLTSWFITVDEARTTAPESSRTWLSLASGLAVATLSGLHQFFFRSQRLTDVARYDLQQKDRRNHWRSLQALGRQLQTHRDPRTTNIPARLQKSFERFQAAETWVFPAEATEVNTGLKEQAQQLYLSCFSMLERLIAIRKVSRDIATESGRGPVAQSLEELMQEIQDSIQNVEATLDHLQASQIKGEKGLLTDVSHLRQELSQGIEYANQLEKRMRQLDIELDNR